MRIGIDRGDHTSCVAKDSIIAQGGAGMVGQANGRPVDCVICDQTGKCSVDLKGRVGRTDVIILDRAAGHCIQAKPFITACDHIVVQFEVCGVIQSHTTACAGDGVVFDNGV